MTEIEKAMQWERMSGEVLSNEDREFIKKGGVFIPPHMRPEAKFAECPFCESKVKYVLGNSSHYIKGAETVSEELHMVTCSNKECNASMAHNTLENLIKSWNRRDRLEY